MSAHDDYDDDRTDQGLWSAADREAALARRGIGPVTPSRGGGSHRVRTRMAEQHQQRPAANPSAHMQRIRRLMGWAEVTPEEQAKRERSCPTCGAPRFSACTRWSGGRGPQVDAHPARSEAGIPAQR